MPQPMEVFAKNLVFRVFDGQLLDHRSCREISFKGLLVRFFAFVEPTQLDVDGGDVS